MKHGRKLYKLYVHGTCWYKTAATIYACVSDSL